ncbi:MAG: InlB B-repeat-containing protein [Aeriscardovia sp.]|nr:InlB B-repeat-containing protein [Aeriscardovia sp.]
MGRIVSHLCAASLCSVLLFSGGTSALAAPVSSIPSHHLSSSTVTRVTAPGAASMPVGVLRQVSSLGVLQLTGVTVGSSDRVYPSVWSEPEVGSDRLIPSDASTGSESAAVAHLTLQLTGGTRIVPGAQYVIPVTHIGLLPIKILHTPSTITTADGVTLFTVSMMANGNLCLTATPAVTHLTTPMDVSFTVTLGFLPPTNSSTTTDTSASTTAGVKTENTASSATGKSSSASTSAVFGFMIGTTQWKGTVSWTPVTRTTLVSSFNRTACEKNRVTALGGVSWTPLQNLLTHLSMQNQQPVALASQPFYVMNLYTSSSSFTWSFHHQTFVNTMSSHSGSTPEWTSTITGSSPLMPFTAPVSTLSMSNGSLTLQEVRDRLTSLVHAYMSGTQSLARGTSIVIHGVLSNGDHVLGMITNLGSFAHPFTAASLPVSSLMEDQVEELRSVYPDATAASEIAAGVTLQFPSAAHAYSYTHDTSLWWNTSSMIGTSHTVGTTCPVVTATTARIPNSENTPSQKTVMSRALPFILAADKSQASSSTSSSTPVTTAIILAKKRTPVAHDFVVYEPNGGTGTAIMQAVTRGEQPITEANTFLYQGKHFIGWNTKADGSGTWYDPGSLQSPVMKSTRILYAQWAPDHVTATIHPMNPIIRSPLASTGAAITAIFCSMMCFVGLGFAVKHYRDERKPWKDPEHKYTTR